MVTGLVGEDRVGRDRARANGGARRDVPRPEGAPTARKCKGDSRAGFLIERESAAGKFVVCSEGREACGYISDRPRNAKQRRAVLDTPCHACGGAMRLRLPKEKTRRASLACVRDTCRAARWFDEAGSLAEEARAGFGPRSSLCHTPWSSSAPPGSHTSVRARLAQRRSGCNAIPSESR